MSHSPLQGDVSTEESLRRSLQEQQVDAQSVADSLPLLRLARKEVSARLRFTLVYVSF